MSEFNNPFQHVFAQQQGTFNGDIVTYVNQFHQGPRGRSCPAPHCGNAPIRLVQSVWAEQSRSDGVQTLLAARLNPPYRPVRQRIGELVKIFIIANLICFCFSGILGNELVAAVINLTAVAASIAFLIKRHSDNAMDYRRRLAEFERLWHIWNVAWFCGSCHTISASTAELHGIPNYR
ncbi:hypothetical protein [Nocardia amikacinitolerans]|uniref:hypothetical protein n=1 Tax=Nocardia amikacinitolerans TaxID=756689 RepID=UPI0020A30C89|nr:hypothetical protein [Nocardia amikacinitolerans]